MKPKTIKTLYWVLIILFAVTILMDGMAGVVQEKNGQKVMQHLGYPMYALIIFGTAKIIGAIALLQTKFKTIKEWAYAGFTINFIGAFLSWAFVDNDITSLIPPLVMLIVLFLTYFLWKKYESIQTVHHATPKHTSATGLAVSL